VDAIIITFHELPDDKYDLNETFASLFNNITEEGIIAFDFIDANRFIPYINDQKIIHKAEYEEINYIRESHWK
jgi:hypothetical protein